MKLQSYLQARLAGAFFAIGCLSGCVDSVECLSDSDCASGNLECSRERKCVPKEAVQDGGAAEDSGPRIDQGTDQGTPVDMGNTTPDMGPDEDMGEGTDTGDGGTMIPDEGVNEDMDMGMVATPTTACADGTAELAMSEYMRADIVFCSAPARELPLHSNAASFCGAGWRVCTSADWTSRNDNCGRTESYVGVLDDGDNCAVRVIKQPPARVEHDCQSDNVFVESSGSPGPRRGSCTAPGEGENNQPFSMRNRDTACDASPWNEGTAMCGVMCCRD